MNLLEFIDKHPVFTVIVLVIVMVGIHDSISAWRSGGKNNS